MQALRRSVLPLAIVSSLAFLVLAVHAFNQQLFDLDHSAAALVQSAQHPYLKILMRALSDAATGYVLVPLSVGLYLYLRHRGHHAVKLLPWMVVGAYALLRSPSGSSHARARGCHRTASRALTRSAPSS